MSEKEARERAERERDEARSALAARNEQDRKAEEEREKERNRGFWMSLFDKITGNWLLIVGAIALFFFAQTAMGRQLIGRLGDVLDPLIDKLPESWQANVRGFLNMVGVPVDMGKALAAMKVEDFNKKLLVDKFEIKPEQAKELIPDANAQNAFLQLVRNANPVPAEAGKPQQPGKVTKDTLTSPNTLYALITTPPTPNFLPKLLGFLPPPKDGKIEGEMKEVLASMRKIVENPAQLTALFTTHYDKTVALVQALNPTMNPQAIKSGLDQLREVGLTNGQANLTLKDTLNKMLTPGADGKLPDPFKAAAEGMQGNPEALDKAVKAEIAKLPPAAQVHANTVLDNLGGAKMATLDGLQKSGDTLGMVRFAFHPENRRALIPMLQTIAAMPDSAKTMPVKPEVLAQFIRDTAINKDKQYTPAFMQFADRMAAVQTLDVATLKPLVMQYAFTPEVRTRPQALVALIDGMTTQDETLTSLRALIANKNGAAYNAFLAEMGKGKNEAQIQAQLQQFATTLDPQNTATPSAQKMLVALENRPAIEAYLAQADKNALPKALQEAQKAFAALPAAATQHVVAMLKKGVDPVTEILAQVTTENQKVTSQSMLEALLTKPELRAAIHKAGYDNVVNYLKVKDPKEYAALEPQMLSAAVTAAQTIGETLAQSSNNLQKTETVRMLGTLIQAMSKGDMAMLKDMSPQAFSAFMNNSKNSEALQQFLKSIEPALPDQPKAIVNALLSNYNAFVRVSVDPSLVSEVLKHMGKTQQASVDCRKPGELSWTSELGLWKHGLFNEQGKEAAKSLRDVKKVLNEVGCKFIGNASTVAAAPTVSGSPSGSVMLGAR
jgi:hypothetical protein